jgi:spore coat protein U-like protein
MMHAWKPLSLSHGAAFAAVLLLAAAAVPAAVAASAVGHVSVTILPAAAGVGGGAMSFGTAGSAAAPVRVALGPSGPAGGSAGYSLGGLRAAGSVTLTGVPGTPVTLSLSAGDLARGPGTPMQFRVVAASAGSLSAIEGSGTLRLALGAALSVGRQQRPGAYHGDYIVTIDY